MRGKKILMLALGLAFLGMGSLAFADSISPSTFSGSGPTGASYTVEKTVTINAGTPTTSLVDVFFLADTTGSMGTAIAGVKTGAASIMTAAAALGNVAFGVGEYKDVGDTFVYRLNQNITTNTTAVQTGINAWGASGGGDEPEANIFALQQVATTTSWRTGSARIVVWFGDAPGHDPSNGVTEAQATAALVANGVKVEAISVGANRLDVSGQATRITAATGGTLFSGINQSAIVDAINAAISTAVTTYSTVSIDTSEVPGGVGISVTPGSYTGSFDRTIDRTFLFSITFTDLEAGTHTFNIYATVDGGRVATEADTIVSDGGGPVGVPEPATLLLLGCGFVALAGLRRKLR